MHRKFLYAISFIIIIFLGYTFFYLNEYDIKNQKSSIHSALSKWENRGDGEEVKLEIIEMTQVDKTSSYIILYETEDENIGYAHLIKGWNEKFKILLSGSGTKIVTYRDIKTNHGMYGIVVGKNPDLKIHHIIVKSENNAFSFNLNISENEKFLAYRKLPNDLEETYLSEIIFYDENEKVIFNPLKE